MTSEADANINQDYREMSERAFREIKDRAVLLTMANEYVCEEPLLKKIGFGIEKSLEALKAHVENLEGQLVGKPSEDLNLEAELQDLARIAGTLQSPERGITDKCVTGELGQEVGKRLSSLASGIKALEIKAGGAPVSYSASDSMMRVLQPAKSLFQGLLHPSSIIFKIFVGLILVCVAGFLGLFLTMESEEGIQREIEKHQIQIQSLESRLPPMEAEIESLKRDIEAASEGELSIDQRTELMDMNMKVFEMAEKLERLQVELNAEQSKLAENQGKLDTIREKSFFERLLRR
jgi:hypothetical protein